MKGEGARTPLPVYFLAAALAENKDDRVWLTTRGPNSIRLQGSSKHAGCLCPLLIKGLYSSSFTLMPYDAFIFLASTINTSCFVVFRLFQLVFSVAWETWGGVSSEPLWCECGLVNLRSGTVTILSTARVTPKDYCLSFSGYPILSLLQNMTRKCLLYSYTSLGIVLLFKGFWTLVQIFF